MITPDEIRRKLLAHWSSRRFFKAEMAGELFFPLMVPFRKPGGRELLENFDEVKKWLRELKKGSRLEKGYGYEILFTTINHRSLGPQEMPDRIIVADRDNYLRLIDKKQQYQQFQNDLQLVRDNQPQLIPFIVRQPGKLLKYGGCWEQLLAVCEYFNHNPQPDLYLRELDIPGVDTKFLEQHRKIVSELLDQCLPPAAVDSSVTGLAHHGFERRYHLKYDEPLIRFRVLDPALSPLPGMDDLSVPFSRFCHLSPKCRRVVITENKINGLSFPPCPDSLAIFGLGYGIQQLEAASWLLNTEIWYWGDIDSHGFSILSRLRGIFPHCRSFLMDRKTLLKNKRLWGREEDNQRCLDELTHLTSEEQALYNDLRNNRFGINIRLEQERIPFADVIEKTSKVFDDYAELPHETK